MMQTKQVTIPALVRVKKDALDRVGIYARRQQFTRIVLLYSQDLLPALLARVTAGLAAEKVEILQQLPVSAASFEQAVEFFRQIPSTTHAIIGVGGGKALDIAKYVAFLTRLPYMAAPTSLSNDGFCSPQSSLTIEDRRRSLPAAIPFGVVLDTEVCLRAPEILWLSGVGDLAAKLTAVADWKLAFHANGEQVDDFAALLSRRDRFPVHRPAPPRLRGGEAARHRPDVERYRNGALRLVAARERRRTSDFPCARLPQRASAAARPAGRRRNLSGQPPAKPEHGPDCRTV